MWKVLFPVAAEDYEYNTNDDDDDAIPLCAMTLIYPLKQIYLCTVGPYRCTLKPASKKEDVITPQKCFNVLNEVLQLITVRPEII